MVWAEDRTPSGTDTFRIKIWDASGLTIYENGTDQPISGGRITIHAR